MEETLDLAFRPDRSVRTGDVAASGDGWTLTAVHTPGHTSNHTCFWMPEQQALFSGDHILNGSTTVIDPPDGHMGHYLHSLDRLAEQCTELQVDFILPAHGHVITGALDTIAHLKAHRLTREAKIAAVMQANPNGDLDQWLPLAYDDVHPRIWPVAKRSLQAHVEHLQQQATPSTESSAA